MSRVLFILILSCLPVAGLAMERVTQKQEFLQKLGGKSLNIRLYGLTLNVTDDGAIMGRAVGFAVTGQWSWDEGYFCREMQWGTREIAFNCQEVKAEGRKMRFTSDKGQGSSVVFALR